MTLQVQVLETAQISFVTTGTILKSERRDLRASRSNFSSDRGARVARNHRSWQCSFRVLRDDEQLKHAAIYTAEGKNETQDELMGPDPLFLEDCKTCDSTGFIQCKKCNGQGYIRNERSVNVFYCPECVGKKKLRCPTCGGRCYMCD